MDRRRIEVALDRERLDDLAAGLAYAGEGRGCFRQARSGLFLEFAQGSLDRFLTGLDHALGDHPCAGILALPEWAAGLDQQHLEPIVATAVEQDSGAVGSRH